jgi:hypothetical protein
MLLHRHPLMPLETYSSHGLRRVTALLLSRPLLTACCVPRSKQGGDLQSSSWSNSSGERSRPRSSARDSSAVGTMGTTGSPRTGSSPLAGSNSVSEAASSGVHPLRACIPHSACCLLQGGRAADDCVFAAVPCAVVLIPVSLLSAGGRSTAASWSEDESSDADNAAPKCSAEMETWLVMEYCNRGTLRVSFKAHCCSHKLAEPASMQGARWRNTLYLYGYRTHVGVMHGTLA